MSTFCVEFLTRRGCHLCADAEPLIRRVASLVGARVSVVDIESDPELAVDWGLRIPVVRAPDGRVLGEGRIAFGALLLTAGAARIRWSASRRLQRA